MFGSLAREIWAEGRVPVSISYRDRNHNNLIPLDATIPEPLSVLEKSVL